MKKRGVINGFNNQSMVLAKLINSHLCVEHIDIKIIFWLNTLGCNNSNQHSHL